MRKLILMTSAAIIVPLSCFAEDITCTATPNCADLGYTSTTSCNNGVKCPWGEAWFCPSSCDELGFAYSCSGTGYSGGSGQACNGKYTSCKCTQGYEWKNGKCTALAIWGACNGYAQKCKIGDILYSDGTCSANIVSGKTAIAVVVYVSQEGCGQALALDEIGKYAWESNPGQFYGATNCSGEYLSACAQDFSSCEEAKKVTSRFNRYEVPAAWAAQDYKTVGTKAGDWCLPAPGIFTSIYNHLDIINNTLSKVGKTKIYGNEGYWSSLYAQAYYAYRMGFKNDSDIGVNLSLTETKNPVRPVIEF